MVKPYATVDGTAAYRDRLVDRLDAEHFGSLDGLTVSSIGLGTYLGDSNDEADEAYLQAIREALRLGCNAFDAAINYRCQRSERVIGRALKEAIAAGEVSRQEVVVATKGGFVPFDGSPPSDPGAYFFETFVETGLCEQSDLVAGCHVMTPGYLADQIERSLENMELDCIDLYYIHNPETQLSVVDRETYEERLRGAFTALEEAVAAGKIRRYGAATWTGFRLEPGTSEHLSLEDMVAAARDVGGEDHHFRAIQLPYNLAMPEAFFKKTQEVGGSRTSLVEAARGFGLATIASASLLQAQLATSLPPGVGDVFSGFASDAQRAIQFVRSTPDICVALVGMGSLAHVQENLEVAAVAPLTPDQFLAAFSAQGGGQEDSPS